MKLKFFIISALLFVLLVLTLSVCTNKYQPVSNSFNKVDESSCTHCHFNSSLLNDVAAPLPPDNGESGEG